MEGVDQAQAVDFEVAIVGAGPAGLSAAGRAQSHDAESGTSTPSYVLLEGFEFVQWKETHTTGEME